MNVFFLLFTIMVPESSYKIFFNFNKILLTFFCVWVTILSVGYSYSSSYINLASKLCASFVQFWCCISIPSINSNFFICVVLTAALYSPFYLFPYLVCIHSHILSMHTNSKSTSSSKNISHQKVIIC